MGVIALVQDEGLRILRVSNNALCFFQRFTSPANHSQAGNVVKKFLRSTDEPGDFHCSYLYYLDRLPAV